MHRHPAPQWASFFNGAQYARFAELVRDYFAGRRLTVELHEGVLKLPVQQGNAEENSMGLQNIAELCAQIPPDQWVDAIEEHFDHVLDSQEEGRQLEQIIGDFPKVRDLLVVRLFPEDYLDAGAKMAYRRDIEGTVTALAFDMTSAFRTVARDEADRWGLRDDELFRIAMANTRVRSAVGVEPVDVGEGVRVQVLSGPSMMVSSAALMIDDFPQCVGRFGSLVGVPSRSIVLGYAIDDSRTIQAVPRLAYAVSSIYRQGPWSVSPLLYWYYQQRYTQVPYEIVDETVQLSPPPQFVDVLDELAAGDADA